MTDLRPVPRQTVPEAVADQLVGRIVAGDYEAGGVLPSERDLAGALGVSRPTVRTALQRLAQAGLVEIRQGGGTTVRDYRRHAGLDLLPRLLLTEVGVDLAVVRDVMAARSEIGPLLAARAARANRTDPSLAPLVDGVGDAAEGVERQRAALAFWDGVVERSGSIVHRLLLNGLRAAYEPALELLADVMAAEVDRVDDYAAIAAAIDAGDADRAKAAAADLLSAGRRAITDLLDAVEAPEEPT